MPHNPASRASKQAVLQRINQLLGPTHQGAPRRPDWRVSDDERVSVFVTYASESERHDWWYDVSEADLDTWLRYPYAYIIFVADTAERVHIVSVDELARQVRTHVRPTDGGQYKLHLSTSSGDTRFREMPDWNLAGTFNAYDRIAASRKKAGQEGDGSPLPVPTAREFSVVIERDPDGWYVGSAPALPGCHTQARSLDELMERMREAIEVYLDVENEPPALDFVGVQRLSLIA